MRRKSTYEVLRDKSGAALLTVLTVFLVVVILIVSATMVAQANFLGAKKSSQHASAYYVAESGINEYYTLFEDYFKKHSKDNTFDSSFVDAFLAEIDADDNGVKAFDYDSLMNQSAKAEVSLEYKGQVADDYNMEITSTGYLGNEMRSVTFSLNINNENVSVGYQPDSILAIEFPEDGTPLSTLVLPPNASMTGPMITNKPALAGSTVYSDAFVTNNLLDFNVNYGNWSKAVIVTSNKVKIGVTQQKNIKALVLKPGGNLDLKGNVDVKIDYILLPLDAKANADNYFKKDGVNNAATKTKYLSSSKILYYNPKNFNPFDVSEYTHHNNSTNGFDPKTIFGVEPNFELGIEGTYYKDYFKEDFVLDNKDPESAKKFLPQVVLPKRPVYSSTHSNGQPYEIEKHAGSGATIVNSSNNFNVNFAWNLKSIQLGANPNEAVDSKTSVRHYNSFTINGSQDASDPLVINIGNKDVTIVTKSLNWDGNIRIVGTGSLKFFVIGHNNIIKPADIKFNFKSITLRDTNTSPNNHDSSKFQVIVYETSSPVTITTQTGSNFEFNGIIFSENLNIISSLNYYGSFISAKGKEVTFNDAGNGIQADLIFAPNAKIHLGGKKFDGVAVGREYSYSGNMTVTFKSNFDKSLSDVLDGVISIGGEGGGGTSSGTLSRKPIREVSP